jgi:hypothetical protein
MFVVHRLPLRVVLNLVLNDNVCHLLNLRLHRWNYDTLTGKA